MNSLKNLFPLNAVHTSHAFTLFNIRWIGLFSPSHEKILVTPCITHASCRPSLELSFLSHRFLFHGISYLWSAENNKQKILELNNSWVLSCTLLWVVRAAFMPPCSLLSWTWLMSLSTHRRCLCHPPFGRVATAPVNPAACHNFTMPMFVRPLFT